MSPLSVRLSTGLQSAGLLLAAALTLPLHSATLLWDIHWMPLHLLAMLLLLLGALISAPRPEGSPKPWLTLCLSLIAIGWVAGAFRGPFPHRALLYALPGLFAVCTGVVWLTRGLPSSFASRPARWALSLYALIWCLRSLYLFATLDVLPTLSRFQAIDRAADGGLFATLWRENLPSLRNAHPFGHYNYTSGFLLLLLPGLFVGLRDREDRRLQVISGIGLAAGLLVLITTQSRNSVLGILVGAAAVTLWLGRSRLRLSPARWIALALVPLLFLALSPRLREGLFHFTPGRLGMWKAALLTGLRYFPFGCGEGLTPEMLAWLAPELGPRWPSSLQFHQTWLHLWAVGGVPASLGILGITGWCLLRLLRPACASEDRSALVPSIFAVAATAVVMLADYQWDVFPISLALLAHLCFLAGPPKATRLPHALLLLPALASLLIALTVLPASLRSRAAINRAGVATEQGDIPAAVSHFERAFAQFPEPYALNMAGQLLARDPMTSDQALLAFQRSLALWEPQPIAHDYARHLWFRRSERPDLDPSERRDALQEAARHARRLSEISPELRGVFLDRARIQLALGGPREETLRLLLIDMLLQPDLLFPSSWESLGELADYQGDAIEALFAYPLDSNEPFYQLVGTRQALLELLGQKPANAPAPWPEFVRAVDRLREGRAAFRLVSQFCSAREADQPVLFHRFLLLVIQSPLPQETALALMEQRDTSLSCEAGLLRIGQAPMETLRFAGVGANSRHPFSLPIPRPDRYPSPLGARLLYRWSPENSTPDLETFTLPSLTR